MECCEKQQAAKNINCGIKKQEIMHSMKVKCIENCCEFNCNLNINDIVYIIYVLCPLHQMIKWIKVNKRSHECKTERKHGTLIEY